MSRERPEALLLQDGRSAVAEWFGRRRFLRALARLAGAA